MAQMEGLEEKLGGGKKTWGEREKERIMQIEFECVCEREVGNAQIEGLAKKTWGREKEGIMQIELVYV